MKLSFLQVKIVKCQRYYRVQCSTSHSTSNNPWELCSPTEGVWSRHLSPWQIFYGRPSRINPWAGTAGHSHPSPASPRIPLFPPPRNLCWPQSSRSWSTSPPGTLSPQGLRSAAAWMWKPLPSRGLANWSLTQLKKEAAAPDWQF